MELSAGNKILEVNSKAAILSMELEEIIDREIKIRKVKNKLLTQQVWVNS